jgi:hypothetical protein
VAGLSVLMLVTFGAALRLAGTRGLTIQCYCFGVGEPMTTDYVQQVARVRFHCSLTGS